MTIRSDPGERSFVRVHAWIVALVTLLVLGAAFAVAVQEPQHYTAESRVEALPKMTGGAPIAPDMGTEREVVRSGDVARSVAARMGLSSTDALSGLAVSVVTETHVLVVDYTAATPEEAFDGADSFTTYYVSERNAGLRTPVARVITPAQVPEHGAGASYPLILAVALICGLALGVGAAWLWDRVSDRVRSAAELDRTGWPVLASDVSVPVDPWLPVAIRGSDDFSLVAARLNTMMHGRREGVRVLVVSPLRRSGSSSVAANTAAALVSMGRHVVLVDADLSSPGVSTLVSGGTVPGFAEVLDGTCSPESGLQTVGSEGLRVLPSPSGVRLPGIDVDILSLMLGQLASRNVVVLDGPPLLESAVATVLADHVDVVLVVADLRQLRRREVAASVRLLEGIGDVAVCWVSHRWRPLYDKRERRPPPVEEVPAAREAQQVDETAESA